MKEFKKSEKAKKQEEVEKKTNQEYQFQLTPEKKTLITRTIIEMMRESEASRTEWLATRVECIKQYEGIKEPSDIPWPDHSNISTMVTTVACDLLHAKLFPMVWNPGSITWEGREGENDQAIADANQVVMGWATTVDMAIQDKIDDLCHLLVVDGTIAVKLIWKPYYKWITRRVPREVTADAIIEGKLKYDVKYEYVRDERCVLDIRPIEKVYIPFHSDTTVPRWEDEAEYIIDERWYSLAELREMQMDGIIDDMVDLNTLSAAMDTLPDFSGTEQARATAEGSTPTTPGDIVRKESRKLKCLEGYIKYDINGDGRREQCVFLVVVEPEMYLSGKALHNVSRIGRRPWLIRPFLRRPGRAYGKSIPELVRHLHNLLDALQNQRIDAGNKVIAQPGFYRPASGTSPRRLKIGPGTLFPLDNPSQDVYFPQMSMSGITWSGQEEKFVLDLIERLTYLTPAMLGRETASRPTARGTLAVIQQGESKFGLTGRRVQNIFMTLLTDIRQKYEENMPPEKWERIMGKKRLMDWPSPEYMAGMYECKMQLDMTAIDVEGQRTLAAMMYQTMAMDPLVTQNPAFMWEVRADFLRSLRKEPEKYIGPKPPTVANPSDVDDIFTMLEQESKVDMSKIKIDPATALPYLMELKKSERYQAFTPEAKARFNEFVRNLQFSYIDNVRTQMERLQNGQQNQQGVLGMGQASGLRGMSGSGPGAVGAGQVASAGPGAPAGAMPGQQ